MDTVHIDLVRPCHRAGWFGAELTCWLLAVASRTPGVCLRGVGAPPGADARVLVVRDDGRPPDLTPLTGDVRTPVALVAYGGHARGRPALARARDVLDRAGVPTLLPSLGLNAAAVRADGFTDADVLLWALLLDELRDVVVPAA